MNDPEKVLRATAVRVGMHVLLIPDGQPIPDDAYVYGPAKREAVYDAFYRETLCPNGHRRSGKQIGCRFSGNCFHNRGRNTEWAWGPPAGAIPLAGTSDHVRSETPVERY